MPEKKQLRSALDMTHSGQARGREGEKPINANLDRLQARVQQMERIAYGEDERKLNTWAFQARRELRRRRRKTLAERAARAPEARVG
jgi:hypothetical protein